MSLSEFFKREWQEVKGHFKHDVYKWVILGVGGFVIASGAYLAHKFHDLPDWVLPGFVFVVAILVLLWLGERAGARTSSQSTIQTASSTLVPPTPNFDATTFFRQAYVSPLTAEVEKNARIAAAQNQPNDHVAFLSRIIGVGLVSYLHDMTWAYIYNSQLLMLLELNRREGFMPLADAKAYYDKAVVNYPEIYSNYSYDQWLFFMLQQQLLLKHPSDMLEITVRGKDFLKYLTHWGRSPDPRRIG